MKILKEDSELVTKEILPVSFITDLVSKSWDEVGYLKEAASAIGESYKDTSKVEELMQDLMDAYLVFIGQLELYLNKEKDITTEVKADEISDVAEKSTETASKIEEPEEITPASAELPEAEFKVEPIKAPIEKSQDPTIKMEDEIDFFVDFDEPDMTQAPVSDAELYGEDGTLKAQRLNG